MAAELQTQLTSTPTFSMTSELSQPNLATVNIIANYGSEGGNLLYHFIHSDSAYIINLEHFYRYFFPHDAAADYKITLLRVYDYHSGNSSCGTAGTASDTQTKLATSTSAVTRSSTVGVITSKSQSELPPFQTSSSISSGVGTPPNDGGVASTSSFPEVSLPPSSASRTDTPNPTPVSGVRLDGPVESSNGQSQSSSRPPRPPTFISTTNTQPPTIDTPPSTDSFTTPSAPSTQTASASNIPSVIPDKHHPNLVVILVPAIGGIAFTLVLTFVIVRIIRRRREALFTQRSISEAEAGFDFATSSRNTSLSSLPMSGRRREFPFTLLSLNLGSSSDIQGRGERSLSDSPYPQQNVAHARDVQSQGIPFSRLSATSHASTYPQHNADPQVYESSQVNAAIPSSTHSEANLFSLGNAYPHPQQDPPSQLNSVFLGNQYTHSDAYPLVNLSTPTTGHDQDESSSTDLLDISSSYYRPIEPDRVKPPSPVQHPTTTTLDNKRYTFQQYFDDLQKDIPSLEEDHDHVYGSMQSNEPFDIDSYGGPTEFGYAM
ncbi:hypothetical protein BU17DRAFT_68424 [Hysterangium stoloniferum]|nr:hypothetical protein BU17DRAFT_68424 [Hysterangium stoloniferum]